MTVLARLGLRGTEAALPLHPRLPVIPAAFAAPAKECRVMLSAAGRTGQCWGNALAESFSASLKGELIDTRPRPTRAAARRAVVEYIAGYNGEGTAVIRTMRCCPRRASARRPW